MLTIILLTILPPASIADTPAVIRLQPLVFVSGREVELSDVAEVSDMSLQALDVVRIPEGRRFAIIDKSELAIRLQLRGFSRDEFQLLGPPQTVISLHPTGSAAAAPVSPVTGAAFSRDTPVQFASATKSRIAVNDATIEQAIRTSLMNRFNLAATDLQADLLRPFSQPDLKLVENCTRFEAIPPPELPLGRCTITVRFWTNATLTATRSVNIEVRKLQAVLVARRHVARNQTISEADVRSEMRWLDRPQGSIQLNDLGTFQTRRNLRAGEVLSWDAFDRNPSSTAQGPQAVRARDAVRITARRKNLRFVVPAAEALQSGRVGQMIRVRNLHSNAIVLARVTAAGEVEVTLE